VGVGPVVQSAHDLGDELCLRKFQFRLSGLDRPMKRFRADIFRYRPLQYRLMSATAHPKYYNSRLDDVEDLEKYRPGGYHPVSIGDIFSRGRYEVLHKLGYGGSSTVWLVLDRQSKVSAF
jgi:hypothetical protein